MTHPHPKPSILITAGPTHEPIDAVRYLANSSSGKLGILLADAAASQGMDTTLLLGPSPLHTQDSRVRTIRFQTAADLQQLLTTHAPKNNIIVMAAAVADYRPIPKNTPSSHKLRRTNQNITLELEPTPDLIAEAASRRQPGQLFVGFALEPSDPPSNLIEAARAKLTRKNLDLIIANPLETMNADTITATLLSLSAPDDPAPPNITKADFAPWLLERLRARLEQQPKP